MAFKRGDLAIIISGSSKNTGKIVTLERMLGDPSECLVNGTRMKFKGALPPYWEVSTPNKLHYVATDGGKIITERGPISESRLKPVSGLEDPESLTYTLKEKK